MEKTELQKFKEELIEKKYKYKSNILCKII